MAGPETIALSAPGGPRLAALAWPAPPGAPGVLIVPGLSSRKENHADFGEALGASGIGALALDLRGHGESGGRLDAGVIDDVLAGLDALAARGHARLGVRGSSMGGLLALHAARRDARVRAVVAICPARPDGLARLLEDPWPFAFDPEAVVQTADGVARGYWHAMGDDRVPWSSTFALAGLTADPVRLHVTPGGGHGSLQHDPAVIEATVAFLAEHLRLP
jgi:pimeloyl-ACP methyl ester carboxylesterase